MKVLNKHRDKVPPGARAVSIMRPGPYGNVFIFGRDGSREEVVEKHRLWLNGKIFGPKGEPPPCLETLRKDLAGVEFLVCCCKPHKCHGDNIVDLFA